MEKVFNYILLFCLLTLLMSSVMFVTAEYRYRVWIFEDNKEFFDNIAHLESFDPTRADTRYSAIILSFHQNDKPDTVGPKKIDFYYDFEGRGLAVKTGWTKPPAGLLVADEGGGPKLVGYDGSGATGFEVLDAADANGDGLIDARDPLWGGLKIWRDQNSNGLMEDGELSAPSELKITALDLARRPENSYLIDGNFLKDAGKFYYGDGLSGRLDEVFLRQHSWDVRFLKPLATPPETAAAVPDIPGSGLMRNLREAAVLNPELATLADGLLNADDDGRRWALLDELMTAWAETGGLAETAEERLSQNRSGERYTLTDDGLGGPEGAETARRLKVLEAWNGRYFFLLPHELNPVQRITDLVTAYDRESGELSFNYEPVRSEIDRIYYLVTEDVFRKFFPDREALRPGLEPREDPAPQ